MDKPRLVKRSDGRTGRTVPIQQGSGAALRAHLNGLGAVKAGQVERTIKGMFAEPPEGCEAELSGSTWHNGEPMAADYYGNTVHVAVARVAVEPAQRNPRRDSERRMTAAAGSWWLDNVEVVDGKPRAIEDKR